MGTSLPKLKIFAAGEEAGMGGVQIGPDVTALSRIFFSIKFQDKEWVKETMAPLYVSHKYIYRGCFSWNGLIESIFSFALCITPQLHRQSLYSHESPDGWPRRC